MRPGTALYAKDLRSALEFVERALEELAPGGSATQIARDLRRVRNRIRATLDVIEGRCAA